VTVRIDQIKELNLIDIQSVYAGGDSWCLSKRNAREGVIERLALDVLASSVQTESHRVLKFWRVVDSSDDGDFHKNSMRRHVMHAVGRALQHQLTHEKEIDEGTDDLSTRSGTSNGTFNAGGDERDLEKAIAAKGRKVSFHAGGGDKGTGVIPSSPPGGGPTLETPGDETNSTTSGGILGGILDRISGKQTAAAKGEGAAADPDEKFSC